MTPKTSDFSVPFGFPSGRVEDHNLDELDYAYYSILVGGVGLLIRIINSSDLMEPSNWERARRFSLLTRIRLEFNHDSRGWIAHHLLFVEPKGLCFEWVCAVRVDIPQSEL